MRGTRRWCGAYLRNTKHVAKTQNHVQVDALDASGERSTAETARGSVRRIQSHDRSSQAGTGSIANVQAPGAHRLEDDIPQEGEHHDSSSHPSRTTVNEEKDHGAAEGAEGAILGNCGGITDERDVGVRPHICYDDT